MTTREKVILGIAVAAAIGFGINYAVTESGATAATSQPVRKDFTALITKVQLDLKEGELTDREENIISTATTQWLRNPLRAQPLFPDGDGSSPAIPLPNYMGFINTGPQPIAIIDGRDYRPGEMVQGGEFQVVRIFADHIELLRRGAIDPVDVPIEKPQPQGETR